MRPPGGIPPRPRGHERARAPRPSNGLVSFVRFVTISLCDQATCELGTDSHVPGRRGRRAPRYCGWRLSVREAQRSSLSIARRPE